MIESRLFAAVRKLCDRLEKRAILRFAARSRHVEIRIEAGSQFGDSELIYSAYARCQCGAGLAYPKDIGPHGAWMCSAQLKGHDVGIDIHAMDHDPARPFTVWEVKSERDYSAHGATTRPG